MQELRTTTDEQHAKLLEERVDVAVGALSSLQDRLALFQDAFTASESWSEADAVLCHASIVRLQEVVDTLVEGEAALAHYAALTASPDKAGFAAPAALAASLRRGTVAEYRVVQRQIDGVCAKVLPDEHDEVVKTIALGILDPKGKPALRLLSDIRAGKAEAVDKIFASPEWDDLALSLKLEALDGEEQAALAADKAKAPEAVSDEFAKRRYATTVHHKLRVVNAEINRLIALGGTSQAPLVGDAGAAPGASEWAIDQIRALAQGMDKEADLLLINWIYLSALNPATRAIDREKVQRLFTHLKGTRAFLPDLAQAQAQLQQGFSSLDSVARCQQSIAKFAQALQKAQTLSAAGRAENVLVSARGMAATLHEQITKQADVDPASPDFKRLLRERTEAVRSDWMVAAGPTYGRYVRALGDRAACISGLRAKGWNLRLDDLGALLGSKDPTARTQRATLEALVKYLNVAGQLDSHNRQAARDGTILKQLALDEAVALAELNGFDPESLTLQTQTGEEPSRAALRKLLGQAEEFRGLLKASQDIERLQPQHAAGSTNASALQSHFEAVVRIAVLLEASERGDAQFTTASTYAGESAVGSVLKKLRDYGFQIADQDPTIRSLVQDALKELAKGLSLATVCDRFDPANAKAKGLLRRLLPESSQSATGGAQGALATGASPARDSRSAANRMVVLQRFHQLRERHAPQVGESYGFGLGFGTQGELSFTQPVLPGMGVGTQVEARKSDGLNVVRTAAGYEIDVTAARSGAMSAALSFLGGSVTLQGRREEGAGTGFRFACPDDAAAEALVKALIDAAPIEPAQWARIRVERLAMRSHQTSGLARAELQLTAGPLTLAALEGQLSASRQERLETSKRPFMETERRIRTVSVLAGGSVSVLQGRASKDFEVGRDVTVEREFVRRAGLLQEGCGMSVQARLVNDDLAACLRQVMPHLRERAGQDELDHYVGQVAQATQGMPAGSVIDIRLECVLVPQARRDANAWLRHARQQLAFAAVRRDPAQQASAARAALEQVDRITRDPTSYQVSAVKVLTRSSAEATRGIAAQSAFANVRAQQAHPVSMFQAAGSSAAGAAPRLGAQYGALLGVSESAPQFVSESESPAEAAAGSE
ncbi:hypothetical protein WG922_03870 [Ramlibacter sp. AN1015]|uniref:hypothetical protein n=1 Tax=Ramlibacter sp. AN1015 TaxID=3133428 RepID=UPI0030C53B6F